MVNFAELKAKAEKAKDASVTKVTNTRDRLSSVPSSKTNWDPNWKRAPPSSRSRPDVIASSTAPAPPAVPRTSRPVDDSESPPPPAYTPPPPPTRAASGYPPSHRESPRDAADKIDWMNLSEEDKEEFFGWLDEFFSRYLGIELSSRERRGVPSSVNVSTHTRPPTVNMATRPQ